MFISRLEHLVLLTFVLGVVAEASYSSCYYNGSSFGASSVVDTCLGLALRLRPLLVITLDRAAEAVSVVKCTLFEMACVGWGCFSWISFFCLGLPSGLGLRGLVLWSSFLRSPGVP